MVRKRIFFLLWGMMFIFVVAGLTFSAEIEGTVIRIEGKNIILKDAGGKEKVIEVKEVPAGLKVGDKIIIKDGTVVPSKKEKPLEGC